MRKDYGTRTKMKDGGKLTAGIRTGRFKPNVSRCASARAGVATAMAVAAVAIKVKVFMAVGRFVVG